MSFNAAWLWTFTRSLLLIALALPVCGGLVGWIRSSALIQRRWQLGLLAVPFLFPELLTGYAYSQMTRLLITGVWMREAWFDLLLILRVVPMGTILWYFAPASPLSREAWYVRKLALRQSQTTVLKWAILGWYWLQGPGRSAAFAACGLFLAVFQEFELASLLATTSWTVWLFDAQAGGLPLSESLRNCLVPALCTWLICGWLPWQLSSGRRRIAQPESTAPLPDRVSNVFWWSYLSVAAGIVVIYPCLLIGRETLAGSLALVQNSIQAQGLIQGILIAGGSALIAGWTADLLAWRLIHGLPRLWRRMALVSAGIGLCGSLMIGLLAVSIFQQPGLRLLYDTPAPVVLGLGLWLLPRAILLQGIVSASTSPTAEHTARLLAAGGTARHAAARRILWQLRGRTTLVCRFILCYWAYWELTIPGILSPNGMTSAPVRLYIDMHFGRNAMLTAKAGLTLVAPLILLAVCWPWLKRAAD